MKITKAQQASIKRIYDRQAGETACMSYLEFRRTVCQGYDCLMVHWCGMWLGIEKDGYTHS